MTALTETKSALSTKIITSGKYAGKAWNRVQIIHEKIIRGEPFKIGATGTGPDVFGISYDMTTDKFSYVKNKLQRTNPSGHETTVARTKIFKDKDLGGV